MQLFEINNVTQPTPIAYSRDKVASSAFTDFLKPQGPIALAEDPLQRAKDAVLKQNDSRKAAEQFVATTLISPLLAELRDQPLSSDFLDGGFAEDSFRQQLDTILADRITQKSNFSIVDAVYRRINAGANIKVDVHG